MVFWQSQINGAPNLDFSSLNCRKRDYAINTQFGYFQKGVKNHGTGTQRYGRDNFSGSVTQPGLLKAQWAQSGELLWSLGSHKPPVSLSSPLPRGFHAGFWTLRRSRTCGASTELRGLGMVAVLTGCPPGAAYLLADTEMTAGLGFSALGEGCLVKTRRLPTKSYVCFPW